MSEIIEQINITLNFAKKHELKVIPVFGVNPITAECFCRKAGCTAVGKHPINRGWQTGPFLEKIHDFVTSYQGNNHYSNAGIAMTAKHAVLDMDSEESYRWLLSQFPKLESTPTVITKKGYHLHLTTKGKLTNKVRLNDREIDIRSEGSTAIAGGSVHHTGHVYRWKNQDNDLQEFPYEILKSEKKESVSQSGNEVRTQIPEGQRNNELFKLTCDSLKKGLPLEMAFMLISSVNKSVCNPPLDDSEVETLFESAREKVYSEIKEPSFDTNLLYGPVGDVIKKVDPHTEANPIAVYAQMLTIIGGYFGRIAGSHVSGDRHYPNLFTLIVGNSSVARKGTSLGVAHAILKQVIPEFISNNIKSGASSGEGIPYHLRDPIFEMKNKKKEGRNVAEKVMIDPGVPDKRLVITETEFGTVLISMKREGNKLSVVFRDAYDSKNLGTLTKNNSVKATDPHVAIIAHITIEEFRHLLDVVDVFNGFGNRFMYFYTKSEKCLPHAPAIEDLDLRNEIKAVKDAIEFWTPRLSQLTEHRMNFSKNASILWEVVYKEIKDPGVDGIVGTCLSRGPAHVKKLSIILAMLDKKLEIEPEHLKIAMALWNYSSDTVKFIFRDKAKQLSKHAFKAVQYLENNPSSKVSRSEISSKCFQRNAPSSVIEEVKNELIEKGVITTEQTQDTESWVIL